MKHLKDTDLVKNIENISRALHYMRRVDLERNEPDVQRFVTSLEIILEGHKKERRSREKAIMKKSSDKPVYYEWWFYPKAAKTFKDKKVPLQLTVKSKEYKHWIDALDNAMHCAKTHKLLKHCQDGDYVLLMYPKEKEELEEYKYQLLAGRTRLSDTGRLPYMFSPKYFRECVDLVSSIYSMQLFMESEDVVDGPTGLPFIIAQPL